MALPSAVTLASAAVVLAAGAGLVAAASSASEPGQPDRPVTTAVRKALSAAPTDKPREMPVRQSPGGPAARRPRAAVPHVPVDVYNNAGVVGLAADKAALLRAGGWNVVGTDNWYGAIPADTVYFAPRLRKDAERLAAFLHVHRVHLAASPMQYDRLTVIFTSG